MSVSMLSFGDCPAEPVAMNETPYENSLGQGYIQNKVLAKLFFTNSHSNTQDFEVNE